MELILLNNNLGNSIGKSTKPILASHPLPLMMAWGYFAKVVVFLSNK